MNLLIRKANKDDLSNLVSLERELFNDSYSIDYIQTFLEQNSLLLAYDLDQLIGVLGWFNQGDNAEIIMVGVKTEYRRRQIATMLIKACISMLVSSDVHSLFIEVRTNNIEAKKLYESLNFKENRIRKDYYQNPLEDAIEMRLDL